MLHLNGYSQIFSLADKCWMLATSIVSGVAGWGLTNNLWATFLSAGIGFMAAGIPRIIVALAGSRKSKAAIVQNEIGIMAQLLAEERDTVRLVRITKHKMQSELQKATSHAEYLEETLKHHHIEFEGIEWTPIEELTRFEDAGMALIVERAAKRLELTDER